MGFCTDVKVLEPISPSISRDNSRMFLKVINVILGIEKRDIVN